MIWCVEDDASIRDIEVYALQSTGLEARGFEDGTSFWEALRTERPELVVLDVMLPGIDGMELLRRMRADAARSDIPVVMATAKGAEYDKIQGLDLGADYYLTKPFGVMELVSCVKAVLRRAPAESATASGDADDTLRYPGLTVSLARYEVTYEGHELEMPRKELEVLFYLASHPNMVFTREQLLERVWGFDFFGDSRTVDVHIKRLREKLPGCEKYGWEIHTVWRVGYKFEYKAN